ncbi:hypothetical protein BKA70DRAFT_1228819 [Coprinopsis sp. MPI-PUGE-AT-0042]|nr:hypothetical protein BKA70DRAFT_1228819 [Coprinopsis sp. MPI-PUGE-AT-0042]
MLNAYNRLQYLDWQIARSEETLDASHTRLEDVSMVSATILAYSPAYAGTKPQYWSRGRVAQAAKPDAAARTVSGATGYGFEVTVVGLNSTPQAPPLISQGISGLSKLTVFPNLEAHGLQTVHGGSNRCCSTDDGDFETVPGCTTDTESPASHRLPIVEGPGFDIQIAEIMNGTKVSDSCFLAKKRIGAVKTALRLRICMV